MYKLSKVIDTIIQGDSLRILEEIPDETVDLIFADPPYWMQTEGELRRTDGSVFNGVNDKWDKFNSFTEYDDFTFKWLKECRRILKDDGCLWVIGSFQNIYRVGYILQNLGYWILNDVVWSKPNAAPNFSGTRFQNSHETLIWCSKYKGAKYQFNYKTMKHLNDGKQDKSIWEIGICIGNERLRGENGKKIHATQKPEKLLYKVIISSTKPGDLVLDPFFGTGTTGAIAKRYGRHYLGIEREWDYIDAANKRISQIKDESDDITNLALEIKPPKVGVDKLVESGYLNCGECLYDKSGKAICAVGKSGKVMATDGEVLSIHKMAARCLGRANYNGWDFFYVRREGKLKPINDFRYEYKECMND